LGVYILIHNQNFVNAPDLRTTPINCVVDIFWRGVARLDLGQTILGKTNSPPLARYDYARPNLCGPTRDSNLNSFIECCSGSSKNLLSAMYDDPRFSIDSLSIVSE